MSIFLGAKPQWRSSESWSRPEETIQGVCRSSPHSIWTWPRSACPSRWTAAGAGPASRCRRAPTRSTSFLLTVLRSRSLEYGRHSIHNMKFTINVWFISVYTLYICDANRQFTLIVTKNAFHCKVLILGICDFKGRWGRWGVGVSFKLHQQGRMW